MPGTSYLQYGVLRYLVIVILVFSVNIYKYIYINIYIYIFIYIYIYVYIYIFFKAIIVIMCNYFPKLLKTHFFIVQIFRSHFGSFFCASLQPDLSLSIFLSNRLSKNIYMLPLDTLKNYYLFLRVVMVFFIVASMK